MNWEDAKIFLTAARHGQFLGAAKQLGIDSATVARRVTSLEKAVGVRLAERGTRGIELTPAGDELCSVLRRVEGELTMVAGSFAAQIPLAGTVRIGAPDGFGGAFLAPRTGYLAEQYPELKLELVPLPRSFSLSLREADIAVMVGRPVQGRLVATKLTDYSLSLYACKEYLSKHAAPDSAHELNNHKLIGYVDDLLYAPELDYKHEFSRSWQSDIAIASATGQLEAVAGGVGIGILHDYIAKQRNDLVRVLPELSITRSYWIAWHENLASEPRVQAAKQFIQQCVLNESFNYAKGD